MFFRSIAAGLYRFALAQAAWLFISFARTKETKQRRVVEDSVRKKFAVCTFLPTPVLFCAKQKELASLKQLLLMPQRHFISFARTKETKQRKFAVCTFLPTPILFSTKQKELASLKQLFVFNAPKSTSALRQKSEAGPFCFFCATSLRSLEWGVFFFCFALFYHIPRLLPAFSGEA